jgi:hypothetical protein
MKTGQGLNLAFLSIINANATASKYKLDSIQNLIYFFMNIAFSRVLYLYNRGLGLDWKIFSKLIFV